MNLIYPFVLPQRYQDVGRTLLPFESFDVTFNGELGVFGGRDRGVLWLKPSSDGRIEALQEEIANALELPKNRPFVPHLTISHFPSREAAEEAKLEITGRGSFKGFTYRCDRVAMLQRHGADGQFFCGNEYRLGEARDGGDVEVREMPYHYPLMPTEEFDWVARVRGELSSRRKRNKKKKKEPPEKT